MVTLRERGTCNDGNLSIPVGYLQLLKNNDKEKTMSVAHPWLEQEPWPTKQMTKEMLEGRIERVLTMTNIGYLGTVSKSGAAIVSPLEFYNDGLSLYFFPQPNSPKLKACRLAGPMPDTMASSVKTSRPSWTT